MGFNGEPLAFDIRDWRFVIHWQEVRSLAVNWCVKCGGVTEALLSGMRIVSALSTTNYTMLANSIWPGLRVWAARCETCTYLHPSSKKLCQ